VTVAAVPFTVAVEDVSRGNPKLPQSSFLAAGAFPVVDQGQSRVAGYADDEALLCRVPGPLIVFGDHTRAFKYVNFPFVIGADGVKVLRVREGWDPKYVYHYLSSRDIPSAGYSRHFKFLKELKVPQPPLDKQSRIATILDQADALRAKRRQVLAHLEALTQSIFLDMFGDPLRNPLGWKAATIGDVCTRVTDGEHKTPRRSDTGVPLLSARSIQRGWIDFSATDFIDDGEYDVLRKRIEPQEGDVLISCSGTIGRVARVGKRSRFAMVRSAALVRPNDSIVTAFLEQLLTATSMNRLMNARANSSAQANLFQNQIKTLPVILPPLELQLTFERRLNTVRDRHAGLVDGVLMLDKLFASLQSRAFRGQL